MSGIVLSMNAGILKPIAIALGHLMDGIYVLLSKAGITNVALTIIIFTIVIYMILLPLTYQQQKFSRMTIIMNPEIQKIQKKYQGKRDQASVNAMNMETQEVYKKYGVRPTGSCVFMAIQLLILFPLYRVIYNVPGYVNSVKNTMSNLADAIMGTSGYENIMTNFFETVKEGNYVYRGTSLDLSTTETAHDTIIDVIYKCTESNWSLLADKFPDLSTLITSTQESVNQFNNFLGVSIVYSPKILIQNAMHGNGTAIVVLVAILIPIISAGTQFLNIRLSQSLNPNATQGNQMAAQMKMMNYMMPIYSLILVFFLPVGIGIYWIAGALIRSVQQFIINKRFDKMDMEALVKKNQAKAAAKEKERIEKKGVSGQTIARNASINTRNIAADPNAARRKTMAEKAASAANIDVDTTKQTVKKGSLAEKAGMVKEFNSKSPDEWKQAKAAAEKEAADKAANQSKNKSQSKKKSKNKKKK